jgi:hypothetical protein
MARAPRAVEAGAPPDKIYIYILRQRTPLRGQTLLKVFGLPLTTPQANPTPFIPDSSLQPGSIVTI